MWLEILDTSFEIRTPDRWAELLSLLWEPFVVSEPDSVAAVVMNLEEREGSCALGVPGKPEESHADPWVMLSALRFALLHEALERASRVVALHAAAVSKNDFAVAMPARWGSGKTTLALELVSRGWSYLSDDLVPLDLESGRVQTFRKPIGIKDPAMWGTWSSRWSVPTWLPVPTGPFLVPASVFPPDSSGTPILKTFVFPRFSNEDEARLSELSPARAAALAAQNAHRIDPAITAGLARLCRTVPAYEVIYGSSEEAMGFLDYVLF